MEVAELKLIVLSNDANTAYVVIPTMLVSSAVVQILDLFELVTPAVLMAATTATTSSPLEQQEQQQSPPT